MAMALHHTFDHYLDLQTLHGHLSFLIMATLVSELVYIDTYLYTSHATTYVQGFDSPKLLVCYMCLFLVFSILAYTLSYVTYAAQCTGVNYMYMFLQNSNFFAH